MKQEELKKAEQELNEEVLNDVNGGGAAPDHHHKPAEAPGAPGNGFMPEIGSDTSDSQVEYL
jgi:hypothetical protein